MYTNHIILQRKEQDYNMEPNNNHAPNNQNNGRTYAPNPFYRMFRNLWMEYMTWTRNYIVSAVADLNDKQYIVQKLLEIADGFGNAFKRIYNNEAGERFKNLLKDHIILGIDIVDNTIAGNQEKVEELKKLKDANVEAIALMLSGLSKYFDYTTIKSLFQEKSNLLSELLQKRISQQYSEELSVYNLLTQQASKLADTMGEAVNKQFDNRLDIF